VHVHDVFAPCDYPSDWILNKQRLWNEQYLLETFLSCSAHELGQLVETGASQPGAERYDAWIVRQVGELLKRPRRILRAGDPHSLSEGPQVAELRRMSQIIPCLAG